MASSEEQQLPLLDTGEYLFHRKSDAEVRRIAMGLSDIPIEDCLELAEESPLALFRDAYNAITPEPGRATDVDYYETVSKTRDILFAFWAGKLLNYLDSRKGKSSVEYMGSANEDDPSAQLHIGNESGYGLYPYSLVLQEGNQTTKMDYHYHAKKGFMDIDIKWPQIKFALNDDSGQPLETYGFSFRRYDLTFARRSLVIPDANGYQGVVMESTIALPRYTDHKRKPNG